MGGRGGNRGEITFLLCGLEKNDRWSSQRRQAPSPVRGERACIRDQPAPQSRRPPLQCPQPYVVAGPHSSRVCRRLGVSQRCHEEYKGQDVVLSQTALSLLEKRKAFYEKVTKDWNITWVLNGFHRQQDCHRCARWKPSRAPAGRHRGKKRHWARLGGGAEFGGGLHSRVGCDRPGILTRGAQSIGRSSFPCEVKGSPGAFSAPAVMTGEMARGCCFLAQRCTEVSQRWGGAGVEGSCDTLISYGVITVGSQGKGCAVNTKAQPSCRRRTRGHPGGPASLQRPEWGT